MVRRFSEELLIKFSVNLLINLQKFFFRTHEDLKKNFEEDLLKTSKKTLDENFILKLAMLKLWKSCFFKRVKLRGINSMRSI
jgi:hypothetical protein